MRSIVRCLAACALVLAAAISASMPASAAGYPERAVKIVVPFAAGGPTDVMARLLAQKLSDKLGQPFIVENLPGAGGNIGTSNVARSTPDGYTILLVSSSYTVNPSLYKNCPYDPVQGLHPDHPRRDHAEYPDRQSVGAGEDGEGTDRRDQGQSEQVHGRLARRRHHAASRRRTVQGDLQARLRDRALQRRRPGGAGGARQRNAVLVRRHDADHAA